MAEIGDETWLVLGDRGFIGSHVHDAATRAGVQVVGASRSGGSDFACDLVDPEAVDRMVAVIRPDRIINAAGSPSVAQSWDEPVETVRQHTLAAAHLLEAVKHHVPGAHLTFLSSAEVYGSSELDMDESTPIRPLTPYGAAKAALEIICEQHARAHGTDLAILRLFNQVGPGLSPGHALADFAATVAAAERQGASHAQITVGNPDAIRDYTDVRDSVDAMVTIAKHRIVGTFNLCSGRATSIRDLVAALAAATSVPLDIRVDPTLARPADPARKVGRPDRLSAATGWTPDTPLPRTVTDILAATRQATAA